MPEQARRHHVVSKFYLRYFADEREQITTVMLPGDRTFTQSIGDASVNTGYYTVIDQAGQETDAAERAPSQVEGVAATAWRELEAGVWPLPKEHRGGMASWLALQHLRGTGVRNSMSEMGSHLLMLEVILGGRSRLREALAEAGEAVDDDTVNREWVGLFTNPLRVEAHANDHMQDLAAMLPTATQLLLDRSWLLTVFERKTLATSDHPVHVVPNPELTQVGMGTGLVNADVIHAPLTRRHSPSSQFAQNGRRAPQDPAGPGRVCRRRSSPRDARGLLPAIRRARRRRPRGAHRPVQRDGRPSGRRGLTPGRESAGDFG